MCLTRPVTRLLIAACIPRPFHVFASSYCSDDMRWICGWSGKDFVVQDVISNCRCCRCSRCCCCCCCPCSHIASNRLLRAAVGGENRSWDVHCSASAGAGCRVLFAGVVKGRVTLHVGRGGGLEICELMTSSPPQPPSSPPPPSPPSAYSSSFSDHGHPLHTRVITSGCCIGISQASFLERSPGSSLENSVQESLQQPSACSYTFATASDDSGVRITHVTSDHHQSHVTHHTSHVTRHTSHVTRHTSRCVCEVHTAARLQPVHILYGDSSVHEVHQKQRKTP